jgi:hypothetical protein
MLHSKLWCALRPAVANSCTRQSEDARTRARNAVELANHGLMFRRPQRGSAKKDCTSIWASLQVGGTSETICDQLSRSTPCSSAELNLR